MDVGTQCSQYAPGGGRRAMWCGHNCKLRKSLLAFNVARRLHLSRQIHGRPHRGVALLPPPRRGYRGAGFPCLTPPGPPRLAASAAFTSARVPVTVHVAVSADVLAGTYRVRRLPPSSCLNPRCAHMPRSIGYGTCWCAIILIANWPGGPKWLKYSSATWIPTS